MTSLVGSQLGVAWHAAAITSRCARNMLLGATNFRTHGGGASLNEFDSLSRTVIDTGAERVPLLAARQLASQLRLSFSLPWSARRCRIDPGMRGRALSLVCESHLNRRSLDARLTECRVRKPPPEYVRYSDRRSQSAALAYRQAVLTTAWVKRAACRLARCSSDQKSP